MRSIFASITLGLAVAGCGPASAATRNFPVGPFDRVTNATPFDVHVRTGGAPSVHAEGPQEALDRLQVTAAGGTLTISSRHGGWFGGWSMHGQHMVVEVSVPMLQAVQLDGPGDLSIDRIRTPHFTAGLNGPGNIAVGTLEARTVDVSLNGPGDVRIAGRAETGSFTLRGPGDIKGGDLTLHEAAVALSGPGDLTLTVTGTAHGTLSGPGDITIRGGARCAIEKHGPGDVHCG